MKMKALSTLAAVTALAFATSVVADEDAELVINGDLEIVTKAAAPAHLSDVLDEVLSGWRFRSDETQAMQMDDFDNPGMLGAEQGAALFETVMGSEGKSCASCHDGPESLVHRSCHLSKMERSSGRSAHHSNASCRLHDYAYGCRCPEKYDSSMMINLEALIASVGRGQLVNVAIDGPAQSTWEQGKEMYYTRYGQLELSCANCHEDKYGNMIRADHLSQGQINGFPTYRLKNAKLNGAHSRFKGCIRDTRAETFNPGSPEFVALELYVASRGNGLSVEGPSVRN